MKERPILMSAPMVRAIRSGAKTQTRRVVKPQPPDTTHQVSTWHHPDPRPHFYAWTDNGKGAVELADGGWCNPCPYGATGDRLWLRETYFAFGRWETRFNAKKGRDEWHFIDMTVECGYRYHYAASEEQPGPLGSKRSSSITPSWWKRPAIFMPRAASRITPEVSSVRVERLHEISRGDAMAEGCPFPNMAAGPDPREWYAELWEQLNGPGSWAANPFVWVISFRRLEQEAP